MIAIIACGSDSVDKLSEIVTNLGYKNQIIQLDDIIGKTSQSIDDMFQIFEAIVISGSPITLTEKNKGTILKKLEFLSATQVPVLGICFGHQLLGHLFGSKYVVGELLKGPTKISLVNRGEKLFQGIRRKKFYADHREEITLASNFRLLAYSEKCKNEAMQHIDKNLFGVQFHPELSGIAGIRLIDNFLKISIV